MFIACFIQCQSFCSKRADEASDAEPHSVYGTIKFVKNPLQYSELNISYDSGPPLLGEHTEEILKMNKS